MEIIPNEIQLEIIKKVTDVKALVRFRSVSKPWKSFIDSSEFISGYGVRDTQPHRLLLRYKDFFRPRELRYISIIDDDATFPQQQLDFAPNVSDLVKQLKYSKVIGSSCGLWCFHGYDTSETEMLVMWNPSIRKSIGIVVPCELNNTSGKITHFGFGVSPETYDPTIVGISWYFQEREYKVGIFTLSSMTWKMIPTSIVLRQSIRVSWATRVATDRFIFWVAKDDASRMKNLILSFDLITHEFKEVNLPDSIANQFLVYFSISKLRGSLVVSITEGDGRVYGVWMMGKEDGGMTSFTKLFTINTPLSVVRKVLGYKNSGEPIMEIKKVAEGFTKIKVYDPCSEHINDDFGITGLDGSFFICPYTETLLLTDHSDGCIIPINYGGRK